MKQSFLGHVVAAFCLLFFSTSNAQGKMLQRRITTSSDISALFPKSVEEVKAWADAALKLAQQGIDHIVTIQKDERTFDNTVRALDDASADFSKIVNAIKILTQVSPDKAIRDACHEAIIVVKQGAADIFINPDLYRAFQEYSQGRGKADVFSDEERYFLDKTMERFKRGGLSLPEAQLQEVKSLEKEIVALVTDFEKNISEDKNSIKVSLEDLQGVDEHCIQTLAREGDSYVLRCDYPTVSEVSQNCKVGSTRKALYRAFFTRAYPKNVEILDAMLVKRDALAKKLGFESFASLDIDSQMAKTPEQVEQFIYGIIDKARSKMKQEVSLLKQELPEGVALDEQGRFYPWDYGYTRSCYKKKYFNIDESKIAEYFPVQKALDGMLAIYQALLGLKFNVVKPDWVWHEDVIFIEIYDKETAELRGYLFLDLYPRDDKYHHACMIPLVKAQNKKNNVTGAYEKVPSVSLVIANFPKASADRPALLKYHNVETFFHEFGHAMHEVLGRTEFASSAGTSVKLDFVEMPSQMFEEWMYEKEMIARVSGHFETNQPLPDELINKKIALKKFSSGYLTLDQCLLALISLEDHQEGAQKDTRAIHAKYHAALLPEIVFDPTIHFQASFWHLTCYAARYYSYLWSQVFAADIFAEVKKHGLLDRSIGKKLVTTILSKGGSKDPNELIKDFLGREPNQDAFLHDLGL